MGYQVNVINNVLSVLVVSICSFPWGHNEFVPQTAHEVLCSQLKCPVSSPNSMFCFVFFPVSKLAWPKRERVLKTSGNTLFSIKGDVPYFLLGLPCQVWYIRHPVKNQVVSKSKHMIEEHGTY